MTDQLTSAGLTIDDLTTRTAALKAALRSAIAANLDLQTSKPAGQFVEAFAEHAQQLAELLEEVFSAYDPDQATGQSLTALALLTGTQRRAATYGTVAVTLDLDATTTVPAGTTFAVSGDSDNTWTLDTAVTSVGAGNYAGTATATTAGAVQALAGTLTVIVTPVAGLNSVTNAANATAGQAEEIDAALRLRRELEVTQGGSTSVDSIRAAVSALDDVRQVVLLENDLDVTANGIPPHSIECIYWAGAVAPAGLSEDIAEILLDQKPAGIQAYGSDSETIYDDQLNSHAIGLTEATEKAVDLEYTLTTTADIYPGDAAFKDVIAGYDTTYQGIGDDVLYARWLALAYEVEGVENVSLRLRFSGGAWGTADLSVGTREVATVSSGDITVI